MHRASCLFVTLLMISATQVGCGTKAKGGKPVFAAKGNIKAAGANLEGATVTFAPQDGQPTAYGTVDANGDYVLTTYDYHDGAAAGKYKVRVKKSVVPQSSDGGENDANHDSDEGLEHSGGSAASGKSVVPAIYSDAETTPLEAEVTAGGENVFDFVLDK